MKKIKLSEAIDIPEDKLDMFAKFGVKTIKKGSKIFNIVKSKKSIK